MGVNELRRKVAMDISLCYKIDFVSILDFMQNFNFFAGWDEYEFYSRPVDVEEILELYEEYGKKL